jgi:hypothetical protein
MAVGAWTVLAMAAVAVAVKVEMQAESAGGAATASITQIRDTLQNLLKSVEDEGREEEEVYGKRTSWCAATNRARAVSSTKTSMSVAQLEADLREHQAAVEEAEGTVEQIQADIALVQRTVNRSSEMLVARRSEQQNAKAESQNAREMLRHGSALLDTNKMNSSLAKQEAASTAEAEKDISLLSDLVDNKQQTLSSLQGELEAVLPMLAQLQENVAEVKRQITDRGDSIDAAKGFDTALQDDCARGQSRADSQAQLRVREVNALESAMQVLEVFPVAQKAAAAAAQPLGEVSFAQFASQITAEDVFSVIPRAAPRRTLEADSESLMAVQATVPPPPLPKAQPKIRALLQQLKGERSEDTQQSMWCAQERERNEQTLRLSQDAVQQVEAEISAHADVEQQLAADLDVLMRESTGFTAAAKAIQSFSERERAIMTARVKDHKLAARILEQAVAILTEMEVRANLGTNEKQAVAEAADSLKTAKSAFMEQLSAVTRAQQEALLSSQTASEQAKYAAQAKEHERINTELARDRHSSQRTHRIESKRAAEAQTKEAQSYLEELSKECSVDTAAMDEQRRRSQMHALEDAQKVLDGKQVDNDPYGLQSRPPVALKDLSPMERAAAEMGVSTVDA